ncbi:STAS domain-containing protein [Streptomyces sp. NPDC049813]|uniref:STAS domain-containing protein n=1 Tax=Streptomyces sp. NPDC049813 TaxID=3365597 RepID=UPI0037A44936
MTHAAPEPIPDGPGTALSCTGSDGPDGPVIALAGDLDYETAPELIAAVEALADPPGTLVTLDLSGVQFFDSGGINVLLRTRGVLQERGVSLAVCRLSAAVERIFRITGLDTVIGPAAAPTGPLEDPAVG